MNQPQDEHIEELIAQIEVHGVGAVRLYLWPNNASTDLEPVYITDVQLVDDEIRVEISR